MIVKVLSEHKPKSHTSDWSKAGSASKPSNRMRGEFEFRHMITTEAYQHWNAILVSKKHGIIILAKTGCFLIHGS